MHATAIRDFLPAAYFVTYRILLSNTVIIGVIAHPLDRFLELDFSVTKRLSAPNDTIPDSHGRDLSNATLIGADTVLGEE